MKTSENYFLTDVLRWKNKEKEIKLRSKIDLSTTEDEACDLFIFNTKLHKRKLSSKLPRSSD